MTGEGQVIHMVGDILCENVSIHLSAIYIMILRSLTEYFYPKNTNILTWDTPYIHSCMHHQVLREFL